MDTTISHSNHNCTGSGWNIHKQQACQTSAKEWQVQGVKAGCVQQPSVEDAMQQAMTVMNAFVNSMPK